MAGLWDTDLSDWDLRFEIEVEEDDLTEYVEGFSTAYFLYEPDEGDRRESNLASVGKIVEYISELSESRDDFNWTVRTYHQDEKVVDRFILGDGEVLALDAIVELEQGSYIGDEPSIKAAPGTAKVRTLSYSEEGFDDAYISSLKRSLEK